jgi:hypothetical protein
MARRAMVQLGNPTRYSYGCCVVHYFPEMEKALENQGF